MMTAEGNDVLFYGLKGVAIVEGWQQHYAELAKIARGLGGSSLPPESKRALGLCVMLEDAAARLQTATANNVMIAQEAEAARVALGPLRDRADAQAKEIQELKGQLKSTQMQLGKAKKASGGG